VELEPAPTDSIERILVPVPDVAEDDESHERGQQIVDDTREGMIAEGFDPDLLDTRVVDGLSIRARTVLASRLNRLSIVPSCGGNSD